MNNQEQIKLGAKLLNISEEEANKCSKLIEEVNAIYIGMSIKGGRIIDYRRRWTSFICGFKY